jgi:hypothetical protein
MEPDETTQPTDPKVEAARLIRKLSDENPIALSIAILAFALVMLASYAAFGWGLMFVVNYFAGASVLSFMDAVAIVAVINLV